MNGSGSRFDSRSCSSIAARTQSLMTVAIDMVLDENFCKGGIPQRLGVFEMVDEGILTGQMG